MALSITPPSLRCSYARTDTTSRSRAADRPGYLRTGKRNVNIAFNKEVQKRLSWRSKGTATRARVTMMPVGVPSVLYENDFLDIWDVLNKERIVFIGDEIDEEISNKLVATLLYLDGLDSSTDLFFFINCHGGDVSSSLAIYDTMQFLKSSVVTRCIGYAYDIPAFILAAGKRGSRAALPHTRIILRSPVGEADGKVDDVLNETKELTKIRDHLYNELAKHTGQPVEKIFQDLTEGKGFNTQEAIEYGLIDRIARPRRLSNTIHQQEKTAPGLG
ncbi:ATP-dependent Clp protease proteolytic subunit [Rhynchospora pubera]|uniref:ATP-dependent Clp protease proteolytic subunit n=1 Tax=Rhynchospora pubera TaxID=906938 RepID=A0AAV8E4E9_9POAL|nr:ATP-dependent Clp protease proteolytic subunit [Rhynchospora pubera]